MKIVADKEEPARIYPFINRDGDPAAATEQIIIWEDGRIWVIMHSNMMNWQEAQLWAHALLRAKRIARDGYSGAKSDG